MKKSLFAIVLLAFASTSAFAQEGSGKAAKKSTASASPKAGCTMEAKSMAGGSCCMKKGAKIASVKPAAKPAVVKL